MHISEFTPITRLSYCAEYSFNTWNHSLTSISFVFQLIQSGRNKYRGKCPTLDQPNVVAVQPCFSASRFNWLSQKHDALPGLLLTSDNTDYCHMTCVAAFGLERNNMNMNRTNRKMILCNLVCTTAAPHTNMCESKLNLSYSIMHSNKQIKIIGHFSHPSIHYLPLSPWSGSISAIMISNKMKTTTMAVKIDLTIFS